MTVAGVIDSDNQYEMIVAALQNDLDKFQLEQKEQKALRRKSRGFDFINNRLYYKSNDGNKAIFSPSQQDQCKEELTLLHNQSHPGQEKFWRLVQQKYAGISRETCREIVKSCIVCANAVPLKRKEANTVIKVIRPWERIQVDFVDLRFCSDVNDGYSWLLTLIDCYTKFAFAFPTRDKSAESVSTILTDFFLREGPPEILHTDNGKEFKNSKVDAICTRFSIRRAYGRPRHPQSQGQIERFNQTIIRKVSKIIADKEQKHWLGAINKTVYSYNIEWNRSINMSPFMALKGRSGFLLPCSENHTNNEPENDINRNLTDESDNDPGESLVVPFAAECISEGYKDKYHSSIYCRDVHTPKKRFDVGEAVLVAEDFDNNTKTKRPKFSGFFKSIGQILEVRNNNSLRIAVDGKERIVRTNQVKKHQVGQ
jgi:transposase InsO family protein